MKVLNQVHVYHDISIKKLNDIIGNITTDNYITFTNDEIPSEGMRHSKALHISLKCKDHIITKVLVDNGFSLNVMPQSTLFKLPTNGSYMKPNTMM